MQQENRPLPSGSNMITIVVVIAAIIILGVLVFMDIGLKKKEEATTPQKTTTEPATKEIK